MTWINWDALSETACFPCSARDRGFTWIHGANRLYKLISGVAEKKGKSLLCGWQEGFQQHGTAAGGTGGDKRDCLHPCHPCSKAASCAPFTLHFLHLFHVILPLLLPDGWWRSSYWKVHVLESHSSACFYTFLEQEEVSEVKPSVFMWADVTRGKFLAELD